MKSIYDAGGTDTGWMNPRRRVEGGPTNPGPPAPPTTPPPPKWGDVPPVGQTPPYPGPYTPPEAPPPTPVETNPFQNPGPWQPPMRTFSSDTGPDPAPPPNTAPPPAPPPPAPPPANTGQPPPPPTPGTDQHAWIDEALKAARSSDDPAYWRSKILADQNYLSTDAATSASAKAYWLDRINRGDGSQLGLPKFQDGGGAGQPGSSAYQQQVREILMRVLGKSQEPIDANSAEVKQPFDAASQDAQRQLQGEQKSLAESQYAQGRGSSSNELDQGIQQSRERTAGGLSTLKGQLIQRAQQQRTQQLQQALQLAVQSGDSESARQLQQLIWNDQYGLNAADAQYQRDRDAARAKAGLPF